MATVMAAVALCVTATRGTSVGAADVPVVPAKGDVTIRLNWWGGDARIKAMIAELQESIDFNSWPILARPQLRTSHACDTLVRYRSHLAYKQPAGLFA